MSLDSVYRRLLSMIETYAALHDGILALKPDDDTLRVLTNEEKDVMEGMNSAIEALKEMKDKLTNERCEMCPMRVKNADRYGEQIDEVYDPENCEDGICDYCDEWAARSKWVSVDKDEWVDKNLDRELDAIGIGEMYADLCKQYDEIHDECEEGCWHDVCYCIQCNELTCSSYLNICDCML